MCIRRVSVSRDQTFDGQRTTRGGRSIKYHIIYANAARSGHLNRDVIHLHNVIIRIHTEYCRVVCKAWVTVLGGRGYVHDDIYNRPGSRVVRNYHNNNRIIITIIIVIVVIIINSD